MVFEFLAANTWLSFALCAVALFGGALTLMWHIRESNSGPYVMLLSAAMVLGGIGFVLGGMQTGPTPIFPPSVLIPWVRLLWSLGGGTAILFLVLYWSKRIDWTFVLRMR